MRIVKTLLSNFHRYLLWLLISVFLWGWIFVYSTDTSPDKKVVLYYNAPGANDEQLSIELEKSLPEGIEMVKVFPFSHSAFDTEAPEEADVFIVSESDAVKISGNLQPIERRSDDDLAVDGVCLGWRVYTPETGEGSAASFIRYAGRKDIPEGAIPLPSGETDDKVSIEFRADENYYICFNKSSLHIGLLNGSADNAAFTIAESFLALP